jgi:hypothetical protein
MTKIDQIFIDVASAKGMPSPVIACLFTGSACPRDCAGMPMEPVPATGMKLDAGFSALLLRAMRFNPAVHDGAVMIGRDNPDTAYRVIGWSYRLFPKPAPILSVTNRGAAFNSCFAMSFCATVDSIYLVSSREVLKFEKGRISRLEP